MIKAVLIVCVGNICRSAVGERLLGGMLAASQPHIRVRSAGLHAVVGSPADPAAAETAADYGTSLEGHIARQFTAELGRESDLVLVMESSHKHRITSLFPELTGKIMLFDQWTGASGIHDPFRRSKEFHEQTYMKLEIAARAWAEKLAASRAGD